jgi:hypothetical protein
VAQPLTFGFTLAATGVLVRGFLGSASVCAGNAPVGARRMMPVRVSSV